MPQVSVTIAGRSYRMACDEGQEAHLHDLAGTLDARIVTLRGQFGEIGDQRITIMAAITLADDLSDAVGRVAALEAEMAALTRDRAAQEARIEALGAALAGRIDDAAAHIDEVARALLAEARPERD